MPPTVPLRCTTTSWYRPALWVAMAAMWLLLLGPVISQLQASDHHAAHGHHHATAQANQPAHHHHGHDHHVHASASTSTAEPLPAIFTWFHECGYCSLWQQFPTAHASLPAIARQAFLLDAPPCKHSPKAFIPGDRYPHARPRAPPFLNA
ncbi:DUF2946 family protein [Halomonas dongshanensis]|uniref:DUF2946 domain-containing protein n=1 Tax=Halomonas dongshanensis TaxID=2890835 RepID=A0ABT2E8Y9_9GAMM|nr:DUF2946 family protein [Halomonas dongshanensis]MCS2608037.1 hypothetical protein [Halomonas dongshanensis]